MPIRKLRRRVDTIISVRRSRTAEKIIAEKSGDYFVKPVPPCYPQFASRNLVSDILDKKIKASDDPKWKSFGFDKKSDYEFWSWRLCGLMCVKMVLDANALAPQETVVSLTTMGVDLGGYKVEPDTGWFHKPLIALAKKFGMNGKFYRILSNEMIAQDVLNNRFVVASVNPEVIRGDIETPNEKGKGGHLVLVWGVKIENGQIAGFYINNPSGRKKSTQEKAFVPIEQFNNAFGRRGFSLY